MKQTFFLFILLSLVILPGCHDNPSEEKSQELCECVQKDESGRWDMHLTEECMEKCIEVFGPELKGMEAWFRDHCGFELFHPKLDGQEPVQHI